MNAGGRSSRFAGMPNLKYLPNGRFRAKSNVSWAYCVAGVMNGSDTLRQRDADTRSMNDGHGLQMHRRFQNGLALLVLVNLFGCGTLTPSAPAPDVVLVFNVNEPAEAIAPDEAPTFASAPIAATIEGKSGSHAATILALDDGELLAGWYSYEGPHELDGSAVYLARRRIGASAWDPPILHRTTAGGIGNPVLYAEGDRVWLFQAVVAGGWSTSSIEFQVSDDRGLTWSSPFRIAGPLGSNVHAPPLRTRDGRLLLPAYDDLLQRCLFFTSSDGLSWELNSVVATPWPHQAIQPASVVLESGRLLAVMRNVGKGWLWVMASDDGGTRWSEPGDSGFPNPASPAALLRLSQGYLLMVYNDSDTQRRPLSVALSADDGRTWPYRRVLADGESTYSYPAVAQAPDGMIHVAYSHGREHIEHASFNLAWVVEAGPLQ